MTLHWWMHWFWVTLLTLIACATINAAPQSEELQRLPTDMTTHDRHAERQGRAMYFTKNPTTTTEKAIVSNTTKAINESSVKINDELRNETVFNMTDGLDYNNTVIVGDANIAEEANSNVSMTSVGVLSNSTERPVTKRRNNLTRHPEDSKQPEANIETLSESKIVTEKPLSLETTYLHTRIPDALESSRRVIEQERGMDAGAIAGVSFAGLVLAALAGSTVFVLYRRRYLNKPQTLNDKCSNPDSSGYLDDSAVRDNSEEMYSLDNDSFLNSLEAMTIQNYWTDTVKHTKL